jgi:hypothetical protein
MAEQRLLLMPSSKLQSPSRLRWSYDSTSESTGKPQSGRVHASGGLADAAYHEEVLRVMLSCQEHTSRIRQTEVAT